MTELKPCSYCHYKPRRAGSAYCSDAHAEAKHSQNHRDPEKRRAQMRIAHARRRARARLEHEQELQQQREILEAARRVLNESDNTPRRLTPVVTVERLNVVTWKIEKVKL